MVTAVVRALGVVARLILHSGKGGNQNARVITSKKHTGAFMRGVYGSSRAEIPTPPTTKLFNANETYSDQTGKPENQSQARDLLAAGQRLREKVFPVHG